MCVCILLFEERWASNLFNHSFTQTTSLYTASPWRTMTIRSWSSAWIQHIGHVIFFLSFLHVNLRFYYFQNNQKKYLKLSFHFVVDSRYKTFEKRWCSFFVQANSVCGLETKTAMEPFFTFFSPFFSVRLVLFDPVAKKLPALLTLFS